MANILVTGGAGLIGSHVCEELLKRGHRIVALDDLSGGAEENVPAGAQFRRGDIRDTELVNGLFEEHRFEYVFHFAAFLAVGLSHYVRRHNFSVNIMGSVNLINAAVNAGVKAFVFPSTVSVYGESGDLPIDEAAPTFPEDPYGVAKLAVEQDLACAMRLFGMPFIIFRAHNVYGERQNIGDPYRNAVGIFLNQVLQGKPITIYGDGLQKRGFTYVRDISAVIARSIDTPAAYGKIFNLGSDSAITMKELAAMVSRVAGRPLNVTHLPARQEVKFAYASHERSQKIFGEIPETLLENGLRAMADWAVGLSPRKSKAAGPLDISKNFPEAWKHLISEIAAPS